MTSSFDVGQHVHFAGHDSIVREVAARDGSVAYLVQNGPERIPMWVPEDVLLAHQQPSHRRLEFEPKSPHLLTVDDFFWDPDEVRAVALVQEYSADTRYYKGLRSNHRFLWPHLREEFSRLLGTEVTDWLGQTANGVFQLTNPNDPLVWHHDSQGYAAAVYLTPDPPPGAGTSFWKDKTHGCRRSPYHPLERRRLGSEQAVQDAANVVYDEHNITHGDNWELVESVAGLYNRLVIWDAKLIHSATSYGGFVEQREGMRLVQLFFFDVT